ncbi:MAG: PAS domain S-box protein, partial [Syntrophobacteraceae bacterium]|nr:PAS domain S-box protein [Syntrophobacteraceae bacterium]
MTDGKPAHGQPADRERLFRLLFENLSDAVLWAWPDTGTIFECNPAAERLFKRSREHLIGLHHRELYPLEKADGYAESFTEAAAGRLHQFFDGEILTSRGRVVPVRVFTSPAQIGKKPVIQSVFQDKSSQREVVRTLRVAKRILENSPAVLWRCRAEEEWPVEWIAGNIALFGYSQEDFLSG